MGIFMRYKLRYKIAEKELENVQIVKKRHNSKGTKLVLTKKLSLWRIYAGFNSFLVRKAKVYQRDKKGVISYPKRA